MENIIITVIQKSLYYFLLDETILQSDGSHVDLLVSDRLGRVHELLLQGDSRQRIHVSVAGEAAHRLVLKGITVVIVIVVIVIVVTCPNCLTEAVFQLPKGRKSVKLGAVSPLTPEEYTFQYLEENILFFQSFASV